MNIALGALFIFLLLYPGVLFRIAYLNGPYSRKNIQSSLVDELVLSLIPALFLQCTGYWVVQSWLTYTIHLELVYQLIIGANNPNYKPDFILAQNSILPFMVYNAALFVAALSLGKAARSLIAHSKLDIKYDSLRFNNDWYYLLSGKIVDFPGWSGQSEQIEYVFADVLVETKECSYLYCGVLEEFYFNKDVLDRLVLTQVFRRKVEKDPIKDAKSGPKAFDDRYYQMPGDVFILPFNQVRNINLTYYQLRPLPTLAVSAPEPPLPPTL